MNLMLCGDMVDVSCVRAFFSRSNIPLFGVIAGLYAVAVVILLVNGLSDVMGHVSTDDALRFVQIRDWLSGQGWFDLVQHRLDPAHPVQMHWSRVIDVPIAGFAVVFSLFLSDEAAMQGVYIVWPLFMLVPTLLAMSWAGYALAGTRGAILSCIFLVLSPLTMMHFRVGAIDHHGPQIMLILLVVAGFLSTVLRVSICAARVSAVAVALSLAIGMEMQIVLVVLCAAFVLLWVFQPVPYSRVTGVLGTTLALSAAALFMLTVPPSRWTEAWPDSFAAGQALALVTGGLGLAVLSRFSLSSRNRIIAAGLLGVGVVAAVWLVFPQTLDNPLARIDPVVRAFWLDHVQESQSFLQVWDKDADVYPALFGFPILAMGAGLYLLSRISGSERWAFVAVVALLAASFAVSLWQVRGAALSGAVSALVAGCVLARLTQYRTDMGIQLGGWAVAGVLLLNPLCLTLPAVAASALLSPEHYNQKQADASHKACATYENLSALPALPQGLMVNSIDLGPFVLLATPHSVLAGPYHRYDRGMKTMIDIFTQPTAQALHRLAEEKADYILICSSGVDRVQLLDMAPHGFLADLIDDRPVGSLERVALPESSPFMLWRVKR